MNAIFSRAVFNDRLLRDNSLLLALNFINWIRCISLRLSIVMYLRSEVGRVRPEASSTDTLFITSAKAFGRSSCLLRGGEDLRSRGIVLTAGGKRAKKRRRRRRRVWSYIGGSPVDRRTAAGCRLSTVFAVIPLFRAERIISFRYSSAHHRAELSRVARGRPASARWQRSKTSPYYIGDLLPPLTGYCLFLSVSLCLISLRRYYPPRCSSLSIIERFRAASSEIAWRKFEHFLRWLDSPESW